MCTLHMKIDNIQSYIKPVYNLNKDSLKNIIDSNIDNIINKIVYINLRPLRQGTSVMQLYIPYNNNIMQLSKDFWQVDSKADKYSNSLTNQKSSSRLPPSIILAIYSPINTRSIYDIKWEWAKIIAVKSYKGDIRQISLLEKLKYESSVWERFI